MKPTAKTIQGGTYPLSRTLFIYLNNAKAAENPAVKGFVDFYMTEDNLTTHGQGSGLRAAGQRRPDPGVDRHLEERPA